MAGHGPGRDVLVDLREAAPAVGLRPGHPHVSGLVDFSLPVAEKLELLIGADLHEGLWEQKARVGGLVLGKPAVHLVLEIGELLVRRHLSSGVAGSI